VAQIARKYGSEQMVLASTDNFKTGGQELALTEVVC